MIAAVDFLSTCAFVQPEGVGYLAISASSRHALWASARGTPIAAFASVAGWHHDAEPVAGFYGGSEGVRRRISRAEQRSITTANWHVRMVPADRESDERAGISFQLDYYANPDRGAVATWRNEMAGSFDLREGGGYRMILTYDAPDQRVRGKTSTENDVVDVRFSELTRDREIVQAVDFQSDDPAFGGTMTMTWTLTPIGDETEVRIVAETFRKESAKPIMLQA